MFTSQKLNKNKTPNKTILMSSEKLRKKLTNQVVQLRKQKRENLFNNKRFINTIEIKKKAVLDSYSNLSEKIDEKTNYDEILENLQKKYFTFKETNDLDSCFQLLNFLNQIKVLSIQCFKSNRSENLEIDSLNCVSLTTNKLSQNLVRLLNEIIDYLIDFCFKNNEKNFEILNLFTNVMLYFLNESFLNCDQQESFLINFVKFFFLKTQPNRETILLSKNLFLSIIYLSHNVNQNQDLHSLIFSDLFVNKLNQHANFIKNQQDLRNNNYVQLLFDVSQLLSTVLVFQSLDENDYLYQLIKSLKSIIKLDIDDKLLINLINIINNFFFPEFDFELLEFLIPPKFVIELMKIFEKNLEAVNNDFVESVLSLFSNISVLETYSKILIDNNIKFIIQRMLIKKRDDLSFHYQLIIMKNLTSIKIGKTINFFTKDFIIKYKANFYSMSDACKNELSLILFNTLKEGNRALILSLLKLGILELIDNLLKTRNQNTIHNTLKSLDLFLQKSSVDYNQLVFVLNYFQTSQLIDLIENLFLNKNDSISKLADNVLKEYYKLETLKEDLSLEQDENSKEWANLFLEVDKINSQEF